MNYNEELCVQFRLRGLGDPQISARLKLLERVGGLSADRNGIEQFLLRYRNAGTRYTYLSNLRGCFRIAHRHGWIPEDPTADIPAQRQPRRLPRPLTPEEQTKVLTLTRTPVRYWVTLSCYAGLRALEISRLKREDLQQAEAGMVLRVIGKGGHEAVIPAHLKVIDVIERHMYTGRLWEHSPGYISTTTGREFRRLDIEGSLHRCRHTFATRALQASQGDLLVVRDLMRHVSVATTQIYTALNNDRARDVVSAIA